MLARMNLTWTDAGCIVALVLLFVTAYNLELIRKEQRIINQKLEMLEDVAELAKNLVIEAGSANRYLDRIVKHLREPYDEG